MIVALKQTVKQFFLNLRTIFFDWKNVLFLLLFIALALIVCSVFFPFRYGIGGSNALLVIITCGTIFAGTNYNFTNSSLIKNIKLTKNNTKSFYLATFFTMLFVTLLSATIFLMIEQLLNNFNLLMVDWLKFPSPIDEGLATDNNSYYVFNFGFYMIYWYATCELVLWVFLISSLLKYVIKTENTYYIIIVCLTILAIIFGATFNDYFYFADFDAHGEAVQQTVVYMPEWSLMPKEMFGTSLLMPFFSTGSLLNTAAEGIMHVTQGGELLPSQTTTVLNDGVFGYFILANVFYHSPTGVSHSVQWILTVLMPWIQSVIFFIGCIFLEVAMKRL